MIYDIKAAMLRPPLAFSGLPSDDHHHEAKALLGWD